MPFSQGSTRPAASCSFRPTWVEPAMSVSSMLLWTAPGQVFLAGGTSSSSFPVTSGAYDTTYNGGDTDGFVARLALPPGAPPAPTRRRRPLRRRHPPATPTRTATSTLAANANAHCHLASGHADGDTAAAHAKRHARLSALLAHGRTGCLPHHGQHRRTGGGNAPADRRLPGAGRLGGGCGVGRSTAHSPCAATS